MGRNPFANLTITEARDAALPDVLAVERTAFGSNTEPALVQDLLGDPSARPLLSLLAWDGEKAVGHILFSAVRWEDPACTISASLLAPLAVAPEAQGRGVGGALIERGAALLTESGVELVFVLGHPGYYPRCGFEPAFPQGLAAPYPISPAEAWMVRALRPGLLGTVRGTVVCADTMNRPEYWRE